MTRERWMALCFAIGSTCFLVGPFPGFAQLVGGEADAIVFFAGSILFTAGGALQSYLAFPERAVDAAGRAAWRAAIIQSAGTLFFNVTTYQALHTAVSNPAVRQARVAAGRVRLHLLPRVGGDRLPRLAAPRLAPRDRPPRLVGVCGQPARLHLLRRSPPSPATSSRRRARSSTSPPRTGTRRWGRRASSAARWRRCSPASR